VIISLISITSSMRAVADELNRLSPEEIDDKTNPEADAVQHNCAPKDEAEGLLDCLVS
jgi:hypothetical protein